MLCFAKNRQANVNRLSLCLSRGKILMGMWDLRGETAFSMDSEGKSDDFSNAQWLPKLAFLIDIINK